MKAAFIHTIFSSRFGNSHFDCPSLPADLLFPARQPCLASFPLEELNGDLASSSAASVACTGAIHLVSLNWRASALAARVRQSLRIELALEGVGALLDHGLQLVVIDVGESDVQHFMRSGGEGWKKSVEEDCM